MKKLIAMISMWLVTVALAATVIAAVPCSGKVTKVEGSMVTVTMEGAVPAWVKKDEIVAAFGGTPKVMAVSGNEVTLRFSMARVAQIKVDSNMTVTEYDGEEMQGC